MQLEETVTATANDRGRNASALHANQVAAFGHSERQAAFAARILKCVSRAFYAIGASSQTQEAIFWNLYVTRNLGRHDIVNKPTVFIEGLKDIYGEAGMVVFEYMMTKEIKSEFGLTAASDKEPMKERSASDLIISVARAALESQENL